MDVGHLDFLVHVLWHDPSQRSEIQRIVYEVSAPLRKEAIVLADATDDLRIELAKALALDEGDIKRNQMAVAIMGKLKRAATEAVGLEKRATGRDASTVADTIRRIEELNCLVQSEAYGLPQPTSLIELARNGKL